MQVKISTAHDTGLENKSDTDANNNISYGDKISKTDSITLELTASGPGWRKALFSICHPSPPPTPFQKQEEEEEREKSKTPTVAANNHVSGMRNGDIWTREN